MAPPHQSSIGIGIGEWGRQGCCACEGCWARQGCCWVDSWDRGGCCFWVRAKLMVRSCLLVARE
eukprot:11304553-Prorocentrum_lima.AAC.1